MASLCAKCKKSGRVWCPHNATLEIRARLSGSLKREMSGPTPPGMFVGHSGYPNIFWGPMISTEKAEDEPSKMYGMSLEQIISSRASLVRGMKKGNVKLSDRMLTASQEAVMSIKPVESEARFSRAPKFSLELDEVAHPVGASAPIDSFKITENPAIPKRVDQLASENVLSSEALSELLLHGFDVHYLSRLLSSGVLGKKENKKMVPTKWAITATDDTAAKRMMNDVRDFREIGQPEVYSNTYLDNHFEILLLPGSWEYEQFESALTPELEKRKAANLPAHGMQFSVGAWENWKTDGRINMSEEYEPYSGRSDYAERQGGGYYAARFAVAEALYRMKRQARAVVFREIGTGYTVPVGVWEVRENVRHAFLSAPEKFDSRERALSHLSEKLIRQYARSSRILAQRKLTEF
ncbi:MAG: hypothetical protein NT051_05815 [Candidatus Micrarchaeota archaeon]|nr:hypothetical protein [Candidatus Micrarchaeota archaeon]